MPLALDTARGWNREYRQDLSVMREAAIAIREDAAGEDCLVVTSRVTQVRWYSECATTAFNLNRMNLPDPGNRRMYLMLLEGDRRSPDGTLRREYIDATQERLGSYEHALRDAVVYLVSE